MALPGLGNGVTGNYNRAPASQYAANMTPEELERISRLMHFTQGAVPGRTGPGGWQQTESDAVQRAIQNMLFENHWSDSLRQQYPGGYGPMKTGQFGLNVNRARGVNMAPYAHDMDTGRPFGASRQPFRQEDPRRIQQEQQRTMGR